MKSKKEFRDSRQVALATWICILCGAILLAAYTVICAVGDFSETAAGIVCLSIYVAFVIITFLVNHNYICKCYSLCRCPTSVYV